MKNKTKCTPPPKRLELKYFPHLKCFGRVSLAYSRSHFPKFLLYSVMLFVFHCVHCTILHKLADWVMSQKQSLNLKKKTLHNVSFLGSSPCLTAYSSETNAFFLILRVTSKKLLTIYSSTSVGDVIIWRGFLVMFFFPLNCDKFQDKGSFFLRTNFVLFTVQLFLRILQVMYTLQLCYSKGLGILVIHWLNASGFREKGIALAFCCHQIYDMQEAITKPKHIWHDNRA